MTIKFFPRSALYLVRVDAGLSRGVLAMLVNRRPVWIHRVEKGSILISREDAAELARILRTPVEKLFFTKAER